MIENYIPYLKKRIEELDKQINDLLDQKHELETELKEKEGYQYLIDKGEII